MMRSYLKLFFGISAAALIGLSATIASAGDLGLVQNGDMELESRFSPHGTPNPTLDPNQPGDTNNGVPDAWGHSGHTGWSSAGDPAIGAHSMRLSDFDGALGGVFNPPIPPGGAVFVMEEGRSFVNVLPQTSQAGDRLHVHWSWWYDITSTATTAGDQFSATIRISETPDIPGTTSCCDLGANTTGATVLTTAASSGGVFVEEWAWVTLPANIKTFDIIFNTGNRLLADADPGKFDVTGEMFVDNVSATFTPIPEPASLLLMSIAGILVMGRRQRD